MEKEVKKPVKKSVKKEVVKKKPGRPSRITEEQLRIKTKELHLMVVNYIKQSKKESQGRGLGRFNAMQRQLKIMIRKLTVKFKDK